ncbi:MAG: hypothetical protein KF720_22850 [Rubrivivax sp.]|nr:hypothetical protein [Rubrivivax sp.]
MDIRLARAVVEALKTALLTRSGTSAAALEQIDAALAALLSGDAAELVRAFDRLPVTAAGWPVDEATFRLALTDAAHGFASLRANGDEAPLGRALQALATKLQDVAEGYSAFLLCEVAYALGDGGADDRFELTRLQLRLASVDNASEFHLRAWRHAVEACRRALARGSDWLPAIDAVELALTLPLPQPDRQAESMQSLHAALGRAERTALAPLLLAYWCQGPLQAFDRATLRDKIVRYLRAIDALPSAVDVSDADEDDLPWLRAVAATYCQPHVDDARLALAPAPPPDAAAEIAWSDHTLRHVRYLDAVPLRRSLLVDLDRTGDTVMELVHELTHAHTLLGPLGWARTACRSAVLYLEMLLYDHVPGVGKPRERALWKDLSPLDAVTAPDGPSLVPLLCDAQLAALWRSKLLQAVWLPWLEGLAVYVELCCDPRGDPHGILAPHAALRSLVDVHVDARPGEAAEHWRQRLDAELTQAFDSFYGSALQRNARLRHIGYLRSAHQPELYLLGYLVVRSLVSRWELQLGRPVAPMIAARLLLDATRNGSAQALPGLAAGLDEFEAQARRGLEDFVAGLAALPTDVLARYLLPTESDDAPPRRHRWVDGVPVPMTAGDGAPADDLQLRAEHASLRQRSVDLALRGPLATELLHEADLAAAAARHAQGITQLFDTLHSQSSLVAVGRCRARVVVLDAERGRVLLCPRTFAGLGGPGGPPELAKTRYSIRMVQLEGGATELQRLQRACRQQRTARVLCSRVVDLVGLSDSPFAAPSTSYVHFGLGDWQLLSAGDTMRPVGPSYAAFAELVRLRVDPPGLMRDEARTLDRAAFLLARLQGGLTQGPAARRLSALDEGRLASDSAAGLAARAFARTAAELQSSATALIDAPAEHAAVADYLCGSDDAARVQRALATPLGPIAFDPAAASRVRAFTLPATGAMP